MLSLEPTKSEQLYFVPFERWVGHLHASGELRQASSEGVYRDMWATFVAWCVSQLPQIWLGELTAAQIELFLVERAKKNLDSLGLTPRHAYRLVKLIDWVVQHNAILSNQSPNLAAAECLANMPEVRLANLESADPLPEYLSDPEVNQLIESLRSILLSPVDSARGDAWIVVRNCASIALQLGAGLAPGDVRALTLQSPQRPAVLSVPRFGVGHAQQLSQGREGRPWKIFVPRCGASPARVAPLAPWAGDLLQRWIEVRGDFKIQGAYLFPSTKSGKPWSKIAQYKAASSVFEQAKVAGSGGGSFRLRHTFAIRQLRRGTEAAKVAQWLGIELSAMMKYLRVLDWDEVVI